MAVLFTLLQGYLLPVAVLVSAAATTSTAVFAWKLFGLARLHDRALFGEEEVDGHDGLIAAHQETRERVEEHRTVLRRSDLLAMVGESWRGRDDGGEDERVAP